MAQSTSTELPLNHPAEAPAQISTSITTIHRHPITSPGEIPTNAFLPLLTIPAPGPAVSSVINAPSTLHPDTPASHGNAPATTEDKNDIWRAMIKTFDDLYQGLAKNHVPTPDETSSTIAPTPSNDNITNPESVPVPDDQINEFQNLFSKPFHCGFRRIVDIDRTGNHTISYVAPDEVTRLQSRKATERFLEKNPTLDASISDFCWAGLILDFKEPTWETAHIHTPWRPMQQAGTQKTNQSPINIGHEHYCIYI